jgi:hypothetical protein
MDGQAWWRSTQLDKSSYHTKASGPWTCFGGSGGLAPQEEGMSVIRTKLPRRTKFPMGCGFPLTVTIHDNSSPEHTFVNAGMGLMNNHRVGQITRSQPCRMVQPYLYWPDWWCHRSSHRSGLGMTFSSCPPDSLRSGLSMSLNTTILADLWCWFTRIFVIELSFAFVLVVNQSVRLASS